MNALVPANRGRTDVAAGNVLDPFAAAGSDMAGSRGTYLKFNGNSGEFTYGAEAEELPLGSRLAVDMSQFRRGWICWVDGEVKEEVMVRVLDGKPPAQHELKDHGPYVVNEDRKDGWSEQSAINFRDIETGKEFIFKVTAASQLRALGQLSKDYAKDYKLHDGELPIVELDTSSFIPKNKKFGKKYSPIFKIVDWASEAELASRFGENAGDYAGEAGGDDPADYAQEAPKQVEATPQAEATKQTAAPATAGPATGAARRRAF